MWLGMVAVVAWGAAALAAGAGPRADETGRHGHALAVLEVLAQDLLPPAEALAKAAKHTGTAIPVEIELVAAKKGDRRVAAWEIDCVDGEKMLEVKVDARTGDVLSAESEEDPAEVKEHRARLAGARAGLAEALATAAASGPGLVLKAEIDGKGDKAGWETTLVRSGRTHEVLVSLATGKIVAAAAPAVADDGDKDEAGDDDEDDDDDDGDDDDDEGEDDDEDDD